MKIFDRTNRAHPDAAEQTPEKRLLVTGSGGGNGAGLPTILTNEQATELAALLRHMAFAADDACGQDAVVDANRWAAELDVPASIAALPPWEAKLAWARELRGEAQAVETAARRELRQLDECPKCHRTGAPWCTSKRCGCSESCNHDWHDVKNHRK